MIVIFAPAFKKANSLNLLANVSNEYVVTENISGSGKNVTFVPLSSVLPIISSFVVGFPLAYSCL